MNNTYFHRVHKETPTRFWVNNPTPAEAAEAIRQGAEYCTTNPTYAAKMLNHPDMKSIGTEVLKKAVAAHADDSLAASAVQSHMVKLLLDEFLPIYTASEGTKGWVSIQGDPEKEDDPAEILREAEDNMKLGKNYIAKIPVTSSGIQAISELASRGVPIIATEVMSLSQAVNVCEAYVKSIGGQKNPAPLYVTHITGIFDQYLGQWNKESNAGIDEHILYYAGILAGREQYRVLRERKYPVTILGGGARGLHHFTEFVGADMHITINWKGTADKLIEQNPPVVNRFDIPVSPGVLEQLLDTVPVFKAAFLEDGLSVDQYGDFPPVQLFRSMFLDGWKVLVQKVKEVRGEN